MKETKPLRYGPLTESQENAYERIKAAVERVGPRAAKRAHEKAWRMIHK